MVYAEAARRRGVDVGLMASIETAATFSFVPGVSWSDHRSFWRQGYRAALITDTAFYRYRHYDAPSDTPETVSDGSKP
jgi:hypothetical protein